MMTRVIKNPKTTRKKKKYVFPCYNVVDAFKLFRKTVKTTELDSKKKDYYLDIAEKEYREIVHLCNKEFSEAIVVKGDVMELPYKLGRLSIIKNEVDYNKNTRHKFDFNEYKKTGVKQIIINDHDYMARWKWYKRNCHVKNNRAYSFTATRYNNRLLAKVMLQPFGHNIYLEKNIRK